MERAKEVNHFNNNSLHKQTLHRQHLLVPHKPPKKQETAHAEESLSYDYDTYWTDDGYESYYGYDGDYSHGDWYNWSYFASAEELTESEHKHSESSDVISEDGQTDQINRFVFRPFACSDFSDTNL